MSGGKVSCGKVASRQSKLECLSLALRHNTQHDDIQHKIMPRVVINAILKSVLMLSVVILNVATPLAVFQYLLRFAR